MIKTKQELKFFLAADRIMNRGTPRRSLKARIVELIFPDYIMKYLSALRHCEYYASRGGYNLGRIISEYQLKRLGIKLGFSISRDVFDYGLVIPHYGTVVVGSGNTIGRYAVLHTATCITTGKKIIGDGFYLSTGAKVLKDVQIANNVSVGCNAVVYGDVESSDSFVAGNPACIIKHSQAWYIRDGEEYSRRIALCEEIKEKMLK